MKDTVTVSAVRLLLGSLANIAREELGPRSSLVAMVAILVIVVLALAVLFPADDDQINLIPAAFADLMGKLKLEGGHRIAWVTLGPMLFVGTTTLTGAFLSVRDIFVPIWLSPKMSTDSFEGLLNPGLTVVMMTLVVLILLGAVLLVRVVWRRIGWGYAGYVLGIIAVAAIGSKDFFSIGRYLLGAFPLFAALALVLIDRPRARIAVLATSAVLLVLLTSGYARGYYLA